MIFNYARCLHDFIARRMGNLCSVGSLCILETYLDSLKHKHKQVRVLIML